MITTSKLPSVVFVEGKPHWVSPASGICAEIASDPKVLRGLAEVVAVASAPGGWPNVQRRLEEIGFGHVEAEGAERLAAKLGLVGVGPWEHMAEMSDGDAEIARLLSRQQHDRFADYQDEGIFEVDRATTQERLADGPAPLLYKTYAGARIELSHPAVSRDREGIHALARLLFWGFGRLREAMFLDLHRVLIKPVPSEGARHPLEAYVAVGEGCCVEPGLYHYCVRDHVLERIADYTTTSGIELLVTCVFERVQWRYRAPVFYKDVFHEVGHVLSNLRAVSATLGVELTVVSSSVTAPDWVPLVEEALLAVKVQIPEELP